MSWYVRIIVGRRPRGLIAIAVPSLQDHSSFVSAPDSLAISAVSPPRRTNLPSVTPSWSWHTVSVRKPYRLDLTATVLRRSSTNRVDVLTPQGEYIRWFAGTTQPEVARVRQTSAESLDVAIEAPRGEHRRLLELVTRSLGVEADIASFHDAAHRIAWLSPLADRMQGVRPPRYASLWEACLNAVIFQQVSLAAASAIMNRLVELGPSLERDGIMLRRPPDLELFDGRHDAPLRAAGLSATKLATLRRVADALSAGSLDDATIERLRSDDAALLLRRIKGIGPWTAAVILLRGFGRLDVFPANDSSVVRNLALLNGSSAVDMRGVLAALRPQQGMLYYHLLLARLEASDRSGARQSISPRRRA